MTLYDLMSVHDGGVARISISENKTNATKKTITYCEEASEDDIWESEWFEEIADREVKRFCVIGGGMYNVELCIEVVSE